MRIMKVVIINNSDCLGGAAVVSLRLVEALRREGVEASMLVLHRGTSNEAVQQMAQGISARWHFLAERLQIFTQNGFSRKNLFKVDTASWGADVSRHPAVKDAQIVVLNWINQGALSLNAISKLQREGKHLVWTMHDMWNCTGICHHAYSCTRFHEQCGECPYLGSKNAHDLSHRTWWRKHDLYGYAPIHFVAVSHWLADKCRESALLRDARLSVIPNAFPIEDFKCDKIADPSLNGKLVVTMGAARLDDDVKGFPILIEATKIIARNHPHLAERLHLLLFGGIRNAALLNDLAVPYTHLGMISGREAINEVYRKADVVLSTSLYETLPGTLIEGMASGCVAVTFGNGGQRDIVQHRLTGYIAEGHSAQAIVDGLLWAADGRPARQSQHEEMRQRFAASQVAKKYIELFKTFL